MIDPADMQQVTMERDMLRDQNKDAWAKVRKYSNELDEQVDEIERLERERDEAREAARDFAKVMARAAGVIIGRKQPSLIYAYGLLRDALARHPGYEAKPAEGGN